jgi:hypothetical protein
MSVGRDDSRGPWVAREGATVNGTQILETEAVTWNAQQWECFWMNRSLWQVNAPQSVVDAQKAYWESCAEWFRKGGLA